MYSVSDIGQIEGHTCIASLDTGVEDAGEC